MSEFKQRLKRLDALSEKCNAVLLLNQDEPFKDPNFYYFTGSDASNSLFLYDFSKPKIITNELELPKIKHESWIKSIITAKKYSKTLKKELRKYKKIGVTINFPHLFAKKLKCKFIDISEQLAYIRAIKSKNEIKNIQYACKFSDKIFEKLLNTIKHGITEKQIMQLIKIETIKNNCDLPSFNPVVNSGIKTSIPHDTLPNKKISKNDLIMIDIDCVFNKYHSDCTRMFFIGKNNKEIKQQYELLKNTLNEAADCVHIGMKAAEIDKLIRKKLGVVSKNFIHASGHGLGLEPHESPRISPNSKDVFKEGNVFAIEPAFYLKKYGLRIENTYLLTKNGIKVLTKPKI